MEQEGILGTNPRELTANLVDSNTSKEEESLNNNSSEANHMDTGNLEMKKSVRRYLLALKIHVL